MKIQVADLLRVSGVSEEDAGGVVRIELGALFAGTFAIYAGAKQAKVAKVGLDAVPSLVGGTLGAGVNTAVVEEHGVDEGNRSILCKGVGAI